MFAFDTCMSANSSFVLIFSLKISAITLSLYRPKDEIYNSVIELLTLVAG